MGCSVGRTGFCQHRDIDLDVDAVGILCTIKVAAYKWTHYYGAWRLYGDRRRMGIWGETSIFFSK